MYVAMVKHHRNEKGYWFEVPDSAVIAVHSGSRVICDTIRGRQPGVVSGLFLSDEDIKMRMEADGAKFPLRKIVAAEHMIPICDIRIPDYMSKSTPSDKKIAKRFLEYYHTGHFDTNIAIGGNMILLDGYTAYLVAKHLRLKYLPAISEIL